MRPNGLRGCEGLALWLGEEAGNVVWVTHVVELVGAGVTSSPLHLELSTHAVARLTLLAHELQRYWAGQIHSHPGNMLSLSEVDVAMGVKVQNYLSLVCPHYATLPINGIHDCGVHVYDDGAYRRLPAREAEGLISLDERKVERLTLEVPK
jgi:proteasome lid subunit RPN8/RPN11